MDWLNIIVAVGLILLLIIFLGVWLAPIIAIVIIENDAGKTAKRNHD